MRLFGALTSEIFEKLKGCTVAASSARSKGVTKVPVRLGSFTKTAETPKQAPFLLAVGFEFQL